MELRDTYGWRRRAYNISSAVEIVCSSDADGSVEQATEEAHNVIKLLGSLTELLYAKGILSASDIETLLPRFEAVKSA